jgi:hypothetical protein
MVRDINSSHKHISQRLRTFCWSGPLALEFMRFRFLPRAAALHKKNDNRKSNQQHRPCGATPCARNTTTAGSA